MKHKRKVRGIVTNAVQAAGSHGYPKWTVSVDDGFMVVKASSGHCSPCGVSISRDIIGKEVLMKYVSNNVCNRITHIEEM